MDKGSSDRNMGRRQLTGEWSHETVVMRHKTETNFTSTNLTTSARKLLAAGIWMRLFEREETCAPANRTLRVRTVAPNALSVRY